jgi:ABC-type iron transport system FetAB permease component
MLGVILVRTVVVMLSVILVLHLVFMLPAVLVLTMILVRMIIADTAFRERRPQGKADDHNQT